MSLRAAIYARFSSDNQRDASIDDQVRLCRGIIERNGWIETEVFADYAISGSTDRRPSFVALQAAIKAGQIDVVVAEALDRLSRDQEHIARFHKQTAFAGASIFTGSEGAISKIHVGVTGTMNSLAIDVLAAKTKRGMEGRVHDGKSAGGLCFGYRVVRQYDAAGEPIRGDRAIDAAEAAIVERIFQSFADGLSPVAIAKQLNQEGITGPGGRPWQDTTIRGHAARATGILRNELYVGRLVWNRMRFIKDPSTGKRVSRMNPPQQWVTEDVPHLRIVDQETWDRVQARLANIRETNGADRPERPKFWEAKRPKHLLTGKVFCACCGGSLAAVGRDNLACNRARRGDVCSNTAGIRRSILESSVIDAMHANLMDPDDVREFVTAFTAEWNHLAAEANAEQAHDAARLATVQRKITRIIEAITDGFRTPEMKEQLEALNAQKTTLQNRMTAPTASTPSLHPNLGEIYRNKVACLHEELARSNGDNTAVLEALRDLIDRVEFGPGQEKGKPEIILTGAIASMVGLGLGQKSSISAAEHDLFSMSVKVVAGARFELTTFRL